MTLTGLTTFYPSALCVTRKDTSKPDIFRSYVATAATEENYQVRICDAASATAAAPMYFKSVKLEDPESEWVDGGLRRNNPVNEALSEISREPQFKSRKLGCLVSLGTGLSKISETPSSLPTFLQKSVEIMTDAGQVADDFARSKDGKELSSQDRYFRFSVVQGMDDIQIDEYTEVKRMEALTIHYLNQEQQGTDIERCAKALLEPDRAC